MCPALVSLVKLGELGMLRHHGLRNNRQRGYLDAF